MSSLRPKTTVHNDLLSGLHSKANQDLLSTAAVRSRTYLVTGSL